MAETIEKTDLSHKARHVKPSVAQLRYLIRGIDEPGGKLPLFDKEGQRINEKTIRSCISHGWCELWFKNPIKPAWLVCKLTEAGRKVVQEK